MNRLVKSQLEKPLWFPTSFFLLVFFFLLKPSLVSTAPLCLWGLHWGCWGALCPLAEQIVSGLKRPLLPLPAPFYRYNNQIKYFWKTIYKIPPSPSILRLRRSGGRNLNLKKLLMQPSSLMVGWRSSFFSCCHYYGIHNNINN